MAVGRHAEFPRADIALLVPVVRFAVLERPEDRQHEVLESRQCHVPPCPIGRSVCR